MTVEELRALSLRVHSLSTGAECLGGCEQAAACNRLVARFREGVTRALNNLSLFSTIEPGLKQELRVLARSLPCLRAQVEAIDGGEGSGE